MQQSWILFLAAHILEYQHFHKCQWLNWGMARVSHCAHWSVVTGDNIGIVIRGSTTKCSRISYPQGSALKPLYAYCSQDFAMYSQAILCSSSSLSFRASHYVTTATDRVRRVCCDCTRFAHVLRAAFMKVSSVSSPVDKTDSFSEHGRFHSLRPLATGLPTRPRRSMK